MYRGSKIVCVRIPPLLLAAADSSIEKWNALFPKAKMTRSLMLLAGVSLIIDDLEFKCKQQEYVEVELAPKKPTKKKHDKKKKLTPKS